MRKNILTTSLIFLLTAAAVNFIPVFNAEALSRPQSMGLNVPYTLQAPLGEWSDPRQMDGCEEASIVMAMNWARGGSEIPTDEAKRDIINMSEYEKIIFGFYQDTSAQDTARVLQEFYQYKDVAVKENITTEDIKNEIAAGRIVIIPLDTRLTGLGVYRQGPYRHTIVVTGYDDTADTLLVNDPLFRNGAGMWVPATALQKGLWNYSSGVHKALPARTTALISVGKSL